MANRIRSHTDERIDLLGDLHGSQGGCVGCGDLAGQQHGRQFNRQRLADFLNLTDDQVAQIKAFMQTRKDELQSIREQVEAGILTREEARTQLQALRESERDQIVALLTEEQAEQFNSIQRHKRFGFGPRGFGRGPRGDFNRPGRA